MEFSTGSNPAALTFYNSAGVAADLHSASGLGVSGQAGDRAFDNTASTGMGGSGIGGVATVPANTFGSLSSFTFQCWYNASVPPQSGARLFDAQNFLVQSNSTGGTFYLYVNGSAVSNSVGISSPAFSLANQWVFFAVAYDGTQDSNNVAFYEGTTSSAVTQVGSNLSLNEGSFSDNHLFNIGNYVAGNYRPFEGLMDDVRLFGGASDSSGVLTLPELNALRLEDLDNVPEPSATALCAAGLVLLFGRRNRTGMRT
jgi:hypothetical protein